MGYKILSSIKGPEDIKRLSREELKTLARELRDEIIYTVSHTGGHLAPSLGVVELTLALLRVFHPLHDRIVWDVGHQAYAYKILTRGIEKFRTLRQFGGISGFPKIEESPFDHFGVGHSSTSISAALGMAVARDLRKKSHKVLAIIGDGSMTAGMAYEALNQAGDLEKDLIVILNDNEMSISKNVGALSSFLSRKLTDRRFIKFKQDLKKWMKQIPRFGEDLINYARRSEESLKSLFTPGILFEAFKFSYVGPIDGHNIEKMEEVFREIKFLTQPILIHILTKKGKGYPPAEKNPTYFHGVGKFEPETGSSTTTKKKYKTYSEVLGITLTHLASQDKNIVAITAAMPEGTGLSIFKERFPDRFFDVGICEQHAVTFAAGMSKEGFKPFVCIYSTFLQRAYDQIVHDVCLQNLPVVFCLDRGGLVGEDGPTHHGAFDLSYLRHIPNMTLMAPKDEPEFQRMLLTALHHRGPVAIRYPRGVGPAHELLDTITPIEIGSGEILMEGKELLIVAIGSRVYPALWAAQELKKEGIDAAVYNARFIKPLPHDLIKLVLDYKDILVVEENSLQGGFSSALLEVLNDQGLLAGKRLKRIGIPDKFIEHGTQRELRAMLGLDATGIKKKALELKKGSEH